MLDIYIYFICKQNTGGFYLSVLNLILSYQKVPTLMQDAQYITETEDIIHGMTNLYLRAQILRKAL